MRKLFFSYAQADKDFASELGQELSELGYEVWVGSETLLWGESLFERTQDALRAADAVVILLSQSSLKSQWLAFEVGAAVAQGKRVLPIQLGKLTEPLNVPIQQFQWFIEERRDAKGTAQKLHQALSEA